MKEKIKVLAVPSDNGGVGRYRTILPHIKLDEMFNDDFDIDIKENINWKDHEMLLKYDIISFHNGIYNDDQSFIEAILLLKDKGKKIVMDIDDYWNLSPIHPLFHLYKAKKYPERITRNLKLADYVTTTTEIFAEKIRKINKNVKVLPNSIDSKEKQFAQDKSKSDKLRIGFILGSTHEKDMEQMQGVIQSLGDVLDKVQFVLCGFDLRGTVTEIDPSTGNISQRDIKPTESVWFTYERYITNNYKALSPEYRNFLLEFDQNRVWGNVENEVYRREWTKDINNFGTHYNNIDVLFVPLDENEFNSCKSELKMVEAGFKGKGIVMSNFGPYTINTKSIIKKGGEIDPEGNCILIDPAKKHKEWAKVIKKLVNNPELVDLMKTNLRKTVKEKYDLANITKERAKLYKDLMK